MPKTAQDRALRVPLGALLFLLSLFLGSAAASAGNDLREPLARLGSGRHGAASALLQTGNRYSPDDEAPGTGDGPSVPPAGPGVVTRLFWARPQADRFSSGTVALPRPNYTPYQARAPPAS